MVPRSLAEINMEEEEKAYSSTRMRYFFGYYSPGNVKSSWEDVLNRLESIHTQHCENPPKIQFSKVTDVEQQSLSSDEVPDWVRTDTKDFLKSLRTRDASYDLASRALLDRNINVLKEHCKANGEDERIQGR